MSATRPGVRKGSPAGATAPRTLVEVARRHARERGDQLAYLLLEDGDTEGPRLTFREFDEAARRIAAGLLRHARPGDRALLVYESGLDFLTAFFGCLYAGVIAVPAPAPEANRRQQGLPRLEAIVKDCDARLLLCNPHTRGLLEGLNLEQSLLRQTTWLDTVELAATPAPDVALPESAPEAVAFLQYTSGSTATPRGVMVNQANLVGHLTMIQEACSYDAESVSVTWMPHFHDYGLIQGMLAPFLNGTPAILMSPFAFVKNPLNLLRAITRYRGTHTEGPSFAYAHCLKRGNPAKWEGLDLSSWRSIGNAAEPVHPGTMEEFTRVFAAYGLRETTMSPAFGLAEVTLLATTSRADERAIAGAFDPAALARDEAVVVSPTAAAVRKVAGCGRPLPHTQVAIVHPETRRRVPDQRVGEIWVASPTIPAGYWGRPEESEATFRARIEGEDGPSWLRTGDLGFLSGGQLYITSRLKDLIIVRGLNHHPQDIEWSVHESHPALRPGNVAAFGVDAGGEERLVLVHELRDGPRTDAELDAIPPAIAEALALRHEIPLQAVVLIPTGTLPKTSSGKVQRRACRAAFLAGTLDAIRVWSPPNVRAAAAMAAPASGAPTSSTGTAPERDESNPLELSRRRADTLIAWLREYAERHINSRLIDERRCLPPNIVLDFGNRGVFGLQAPQRFGGLALGEWDALRVYIQLAAVDPTIATLVFLHNTNGLRPILHHAPEALREELLPLLAAGRELAAFTLSEPGAGSNLGALEARATPEGDGWRIDGVKRWNGSAWTGVITVFARLVDARGRARAPTAFVVRQSEPGVHLGPESLTMGIRGIIQNSVEFRGVHVTPARMLGTPGGGMAVAADVLSHGRLATGSVALGVALRALQLVGRYTARRTIDTGLLADNPQTIVAVSEVAHRIALDTALLQQEAGRIDAGLPIQREVAMAIKVAATDTGNAAADLAVQLLGGRGYMENNIAPQLFRDARMLSIGEGANEGLIGAIGRGVRMGEEIVQYLGELDPSGGVAGRLRALATRLESLRNAGPVVQPDARVWHDAQLGRAAIAALRLAIAHRMGASLPTAWAEATFAAALVAAEQGTPALAAAETGDALRAVIASYRDWIGDVEPLAPDVDVALDPLLRREANPSE
ncbi:MAG TPA: AMP-binding protein [Gemmatimonadales bacterium]|nr:AMP-binding protein [Gemmatimonadales bacterium]